jgi:hypothetical protein
VFEDCKNNEEKLADGENSMNPELPETPKTMKHTLNYAKWNLRNYVAD